MKKVLSLFVSILLIIGIFSVVPASAETVFEDLGVVPKLSKFEDLYSSNMTIKHNFKRENATEQIESKYFKLEMPETGFVCMDFSGKYNFNYLYNNNFEYYLNFYKNTTMVGSVYSKTLSVDDIFGNQGPSKFSLDKGVYYVEISQKYDNNDRDKIDNDVALIFGYLPSNTEFFSVDFVKSENNGKNITFKLNTLDTLSKMVINDSNGAGGDSFWTISVVGQECAVDKDGYFTIGLNEKDSGYCYLSVGIKDIFGNEFSKWYGIMTNYTTVVENIPATVEYTGKPITLKGLKVITGYKHNSCATYDVKYENNTDVGTAKVTITGNGNFIGSVTKTFKIVHTKHKNVVKVTKAPTYFNKGKKTTTCSVCGKISSVSIPKLTLNTPSVSVKSGKKKTATISWNKISGTDGYVIYSSTKKKSGYKKVTTIKKSSTKSYTNKNLKSKKTYYYKIRSYKKVSGKTIYSNYSSVKSIKIK